MAAYNRVAAVVDQALSISSDDAVSRRGDLAVLGGLGNAHTLPTEAAQSIMRDVSPQHVLKEVLLGADHSGSARDAEEEKNDLGMFGFTFQLCVVSPAFVTTTTVLTVCAPLYTSITVCAYECTMVHIYPLIAMISDQLLTTTIRLLLCTRSSSPLASTHPASC